MDTVNLLGVCTIAFVAVFVLLTTLALVMQLITVLFPERARAVDPVVAAAVAGVVARVWPGARVTRIEEER